MVPHSRHAESIHPPIRSANKKQVRKGKVKHQVYCGRCMVPITAGQLHKCMKLEPSILPKFKRPECPYCHKSVKVTLQAHIRGAHPEKASQSTTVAKPNTCRICGIIAESALVLQVHNERAHGITNNLSRQQSRPLSSGTATSPDTSSENDRRQRDASHGWGGSFRDHGQFGSHPSFDSMDDESSAQ